MTVLATLHQPSSEILYTFDRLIMLSEGKSIYNGPVSEITNLLESFGYKLGKYENPADVMMKMAHEPERIQKGLTIKKITQIVENTYK